jgi:hypothetical protein
LRRLRRSLQPHPGGKADAPGFAGWEAQGDGELLASLGHSQAAADAARDVLLRQVDILRRRDISWAAIGAALDISRQAAWERFS